MALRAGASPAAEAGWGQFEDRELRVHVAYEKGVGRYSWSAAKVSAQQARDYLANLAAEFLDPAGFDLLPADILLTRKGLDRAFRQESNGQPSEETRLRYRTEFQAAIDDDGERFQFRSYQPMKLLSLLSGKVPDDAFEKVRRRFRLLDSTILRAPSEASG